MATKKKVASKTTKKAVPAKKAVAKKAAPAAKKPAAKSAPAKKVTATKAVAKKAAPKAKPAPASKKPVKKVVEKAAPKKAAAKKPVPAPKKAAVVKAPVKKAAPASKAPAVKSTPVKAKPVAKPAPAVKAPTAKPAPTASKPAPKVVAQPVISKTVEKANMPAKNKQEKPEKEPVKKAGKTEEPVKQVAAVRPAPRAVSKATSSSARPTMKSVTYAPEFTKSVLDQPEAPTGPIYRYSDPELQEFREIILKKLEAAKKELVYLQGLITRKDEAGTDDTENKYMSMEDGSGSQEREQLNQMASRQIQFIDHLEKAMVRIENKTYGICRVTGKLIDKARLKAVPHATLSIEAKLAKSK